jgi:hypothetical protein
MVWFNEPPEWCVKNGELSVRTADNTDFWQKTFYEFEHDNGHFLYHEVSGDFTMQVTFVGKYEALYDQAGIMLRVDEKNWAKTGIEFTDGEIHLSAVLTRDFSDWSVMKMTEYRGSLTIRMTRHGSAIRIQYLDEKNTWQLIRLGYLAMPETCQAGIMCCSPTRASFEVKFKDFSITEPISMQLHE